MKKTKKQIDRMHKGMIFTHSVKTKDAKGHIVKRPLTKDEFIAKKKEFTEREKQNG